MGLTPLHNLKKYSFEERLEETMELETDCQLLTTYHSAYWCEQENDWSCGLTALRIALRYFSYEVEEAEIIRVLADKGLAVTQVGIFPSYLALASAYLGFKPVVRFHIDNFSGSGMPLALADSSPTQLAAIFRHRLLCGVLQKWQQLLLQSLLQMLQLGLPLYIVPDTFRPNSNDITKVLTQGGVAIARIMSREYYGVSED